MMSFMLGLIPPEEVIQATVDCGLDAVDWITMHGSDPVTLKKMCSDAGIHIAAYTVLKNKFIDGEADYMDELRASLDETAEMGAPVLMIPPFGHKNVDMQESRKLWQEYYVKAMELAAGYPFELTLESTGMPDSPITTGSECRTILDAAPGLKVTFDVGNIVTAGDMFEAYELQKDEIVHFHLKDWKISDTPIPGGELKRCGKYFADAMIGTGDVDLKKFWSVVDPALKEKCFVNIESIDFTGTLSRKNSIKEIVENLKDW